MAKHDSTPIPPTTKNLIGQQYGRLTVIAYAGKRNNRPFWTCQCACGNTVDVREDTLSTKVKGEKSCGCYSRERASIQLRNRLQDLTGKRFNRFIVIEYAGSQGHKHFWKCRCDCGTIKVMRADTLKEGRTKSCGCYNSDKNKSRIARERMTTHGMSDAPIYAIWCAMKARCTNPNNRAYEYYGGRGILVCPRWINSFEAFYADMGDPPTEEHSIDRIDNDGNYEPQNCRWATRSEQSRNRRRRGTR